MIILDAEYQFDRHKLTFYFEADRRIDFRELVSDLFSLYKTRIWMQQVDTSTLPTWDDPPTRLAQAAGFHSPSSTSCNPYLIETERLNRLNIQSRITLEGDYKESSERKSTPFIHNR